MLERPDDYRERRSDYQEPLQIFLVGTAHVSAQSADDVRRVVRAVQPDAVVVELCRSRQALMQAQPPESQRQQPGPNLLGLSGGPLLPAFMRSVELGGTAAVLLRVLLARLSTQLSGKLGVQGGMEFVAARQEAEAIGAQVGAAPWLPAMPIATWLCVTNASNVATTSCCSWCSGTGRSRSPCSVLGAR